MAKDIRPVSTAIPSAIPSLIPGGPTAEPTIRPTSTRVPVRDQALVDVEILRSPVRSSPEAPESGIGTISSTPLGVESGLAAAVAAAAANAGFSEEEMLQAVNRLYAAWASGTPPEKSDISEEMLAAIQSMLDYGSSADSGTVPEETLTAMQDMLNYWNTETASKEDLLAMLGMSEGDSEAAGALLAFIEALGGGSSTFEDLFSTTDDDYLEFIEGLGINPTGDFSEYSWTQMLEQLGIGGDGTSSAAAAALVELFERLGVSETELASSLRDAGIPEAARSELLARLGISTSDGELSLDVDALFTRETPSLTSIQSAFTDLYAGWSEATSAAGDVDVKIIPLALTPGAFGAFLDGLKDDPTGGAPKQDLLLDPPWEKDRPAGEPGGGREGRIERQQRRNAMREARAEHRAETRETRGGRPAGEPAGGREGRIERQERREAMREARGDHRAQLLKGAAHGIRRDRDDCGSRCFGSKNHPAVPPGLLSKVREGKIDQSCHNDITSLFGSKFPLDINAFVQWVLRESYLQSTEDLYYYAEKVQYYNDVKESIRNELADMNAILAEYAGADEDTAIDPPVDMETFDTAFTGSSSYSSDEGEASAEAEASTEEDSGSTEETAETSTSHKQGQSLPPPASPTESKSVGTKEISSGSTHVGLNEDDGGHQAAVDTAKSQTSQIAADILDYYYSLDPEAQAAFLEALYTKGIDYVVKMTEDDSGLKGDDDTYKGSATYIPTEGMTIEEIVAELEKKMNSKAATVANDVDEYGEDNWDQSEYDNVSSKATLPSFEYEATSAASDAAEATDSSSSTTTTADASDGQATTKAELEAYIAELEEQVSSVGDDAQLANVDLQNMLQKQQQTLQMLSNISKTLYDTAMSIVRNMGG